MITPHQNSLWTHSNRNNPNPDATIQVLQVQAIRVVTWFPQQSLLQLLLWRSMEGKETEKHSQISILQQSHSLLYKEQTEITRQQQYNGLA